MSTPENKRANQYPSLSDLVAPTLDPSPGTGTVDSIPVIASLNGAPFYASVAPSYFGGGGGSGLQQPTGQAVNSVVAMTAATGTATVAVGGTGAPQGALFNGSTGVTTVQVPQGSTAANVFLNGAGQFAVPSVDAALPQPAAAVPVGSLVVAASAGTTPDFIATVSSVGGASVTGTTVPSGVLLNAGAVGAAGVTVQPYPTTGTATDQFLNGAGQWAVPSALPQPAAAVPIGSLVVAASAGTTPDFIATVSSVGGASVTGTTVPSGVLLNAGAVGAAGVTVQPYPTTGTATDQFLNGAGQWAVPPGSGDAGIPQPAAVVPNNGFVVTSGVGTVPETITATTVIGGTGSGVGSGVVINDGGATGAGVQIVPYPQGLPSTYYFAGDGTFVALPGPGDAGLPQPALAVNPKSLIIAETTGTTPDFVATTSSIGGTGSPQVSGVIINDSVTQGIHVLPLPTTGAPAAEQFLNGTGAWAVPAGATEAGIPLPALAVPNNGLVIATAVGTAPDTITSTSVLGGAYPSGGAEVGSGVFINTGTPGSGGAALTPFPAGNNPKYYLAGNGAYVALIDNALPQAAAAVPAKSLVLAATAGTAPDFVATVSSVGGLSITGTPQLSGVVINDATLGSGLGAHISAYPPSNATDFFLDGTGNFANIITAINDAALPQVTVAPAVNSLIQCSGAGTGPNFVADTATVGGTGTAVGVVYNGSSGVSVIPATFSPSFGTGANSGPDYVGNIALGTVGALPMYYQPATGAFCTDPSSSIRYKENVVSIDPADAFNKVMQVRAVEFDYIGQEGSRRQGFIAEETDPLFPLSTRHKDGEIEGIDHPQLITPLYGAVQYSARKTARLEEQIAELQEEIRFLKKARTEN